VRHRNRTDLAVLRCRELFTGVRTGHADPRCGEVDIAPAQRDELAAAQSRERCRQVDRCVLRGRGGADERPDLLGTEHLEVQPPPLAKLLHVRRGVARQPVHLLRAAENAVQLSQQLVLRPRATREGRPPAFDVAGSEVIEAPVAERGDQPAVDARPVRAQSRGLARAVVLDVTQPLPRSVGEGHARASLPRQRPRFGLLQHAAQPRLRGAPREPTGRRAASPRIRRTDAALHLAPVRQPILGVPGGPAGALASEHVTAGRNIP